MTVTQTSTSETVDAFFGNFGEGNIPGVLDLFADKVDFRVTGSPLVPWTGARSSKEEISQFFASFGVLTGPEHFELSHKIVQGEDAVVIANCVFGVEATSKKFHNHYALHFTVTDGKIVRYHMYEDSYAIHEAFTA
ncbi:nuclear transport factor 2 family protein [Streptomyces sp. TRM49041]|uniref:nuclear transport factor 2 family protein n=1 Tax=Streptomyces sp. TRM49041 TaxID=2603216 RepID=UPI0011EE4A06|nr:nuclear transport factor 2 family protein [Streptomyces sp. TRM49041]